MMEKSVTKRISLKEKLYEYVALPLLSGFYGFAIFFTTLIFAKWIGSLIGSIPNFVIEIEDAEMSILGFFFLFLIRFLKNFTPENKNKNAKHFKHP